VGVQGNGTKRGVVGLGGPVGDYYKGVRDLPGLRFACLKAQGELEGGSAAQGASGSKSQPTKPIEIIDGCTPFETANQREAQLLANKAREAEEEVDGTTEALNETPKELDDSQRNILARVLLCKDALADEQLADAVRAQAIALCATGG